MLLQRHHTDGIAVDREVDGVKAGRENTHPSHRLVKKRLGLEAPGLGVLEREAAHSEYVVVALHVHAE